MKQDLQIWKSFLNNYNGCSYIQELNQISNSDLQLFTDRAGGKTLGCASYPDGAWTVLNWPKHWSSEILNDITYLEIIPVAMAIFLWKERFEAKTILFHCDNMAVVTIVNSKTPTSERVMSSVRHIVFQALTYNFQFKAKHISFVCNTIADALSRGQMQRFRELVPNAEDLPKKIGQEFLNFLKQKLQN